MVRCVCIPVVVAGLAAAAARACPPDATMRGAGAGGARLVALEGGAPQSPPPRPPARVSEMEAHRASGVVSAWLSNNVRVHHKYMPADAENTPATPGVVMRINFFGGDLLETEQTRGLSLLASSAFRLSERAEDGMLGADEARALAESGLSVHGESWPDAVVLRVVGSRTDILSAAPMLIGLVSSPRVAYSGAEALRAEALAEINARARSDAGIVSEALVDLTFPGREARTRFLSPQQVERHSARAAQAWLQRVVDESPIEASIVGDIPLEDALALAEEVLGSLPARARPGPEDYPALRGIVRPRGSLTGEYVRPTPGGVAFAVRGFFGADIGDVREHRALAVAARIAAARVRDREGVREVSGESIPSSVYPGFGMAIVAATVDPRHAGCVQGMMDGVIRELATAGPTEAEVRAQAKELADRVRSFEAEPNYWAAILCRSTTRGIDPDDLFDGAAVYERFTAADVRSAVRKYAGETGEGTSDAGEGAIRLVVRPE